MTVLLARSALDTIRCEANAATDGNETGGILLGYDHSADGMEIRHAGGPGPRAIRASHRFTRDTHHAQQLADKAWSQDRSIWLGEWHTHPNGEPQPSDLDLSSYLAMLDDPDLSFHAFLAVIVTPTIRSVTLYPWLVTRSAITCAGLWIR